MSAKKLRKFLHSEAQKLGVEAYQKPDTLSEDALARLERLERVVKLYESTIPKIKPRRWPTIVTLAATSLMISLLLVLRVPSTEIELDIRVNELQFTLSKQTVLTDAMVLTALGISELEEIRLPRSRGQAAQIFSNAMYQGVGSALRLSTIDAEHSQSTLTLTALLLPADTLVKISNSASPNQYRLLLEFSEKSDFTVQVSAKGQIMVAPSGAPAAQYDFSIPSSIQLKPANRQITFDLTLPEGTQTSLASHLPVKDVLFTRVDEFIGIADTFVRQVSTILGGQLYLADLSSKEYTIRSGEGLLLDGSRGPINSLTIEEDAAISLLFHGSVSGMSSGWEDNRQNLMPNIMEWIVARPGLMLFWSQTVSFFLLVLGIWRWWKTTG
ncbi:MAG: hypothetical protein GY801_45570 [bacterium]|nr:hypothetical protein [bacterium]